jgi:TonB family protein
MNLPITATSALVFFVACVGKATVVFALAVLVVACMHRSSAGSRHHVWTVSILAALALPFLTVLLPVWHSTSLAHAATLLTTAHSAAPTHTSSYAEPMIVNATTLAIHGAGLWVLVIWALGAVIVASRLLVGIVRLAIRSTRSHALLTDAWNSDLCALAESLSVSRPVRLLEYADSIATPLTWRILRPVILLPAGASDWPAERRRIVLSHELAHIARGDWLLHICGELVRALYWFHPLAWIASAGLRHESECACDDAVLNSGIPACEYADELLALASTLTNSRTGVCPALAIARCTNLERRFAAMLNPSLNRDASHTSKLLTKLVAVCLLFPLAAFRLPAQNAAGNFTGTIYDASGAVVPNATIVMTGLKSKTVDMSTSAADGTFSFKALPAGVYEMKVMKPGFEAYHDPRVDLEATHVLSRNVHLNVGSITESVDVHATDAGQTASSKGNTPPARVKIGGEIEAAKLIKKVAPSYPESAKAAGVQGQVVLHAVIGMDGKPLSLQVLNSTIDPDLARASVEAVSRWRYSPTLLNGQPIEVDTTIMVNFSLLP